MVSRTELKVCWGNYDFRFIMIFICYWVDDCWRIYLDFVDYIFSDRTKNIICEFRTWHSFVKKRFLTSELNIFLWRFVLWRNLNKFREWNVNILLVLSVMMRFATFSVFFFSLKIVCVYTTSSSTTLKWWQNENRNMIFIRNIRLDIYLK